MTSPGIVLALALGVAFPRVVPEDRTSTISPPRALQGQGGGRTQIKDDPFDSVVTVIAPWRPKNELQPFLVTLRTRMMRGSGVAVHELYAVHEYRGEWVFWNRAQSDEQATLEFNEISSNVISCRGSGGCLHEEHFSVDLEEAYLRKRVQTGFRVKFYATKTANEQVVTVDAAHLFEQLRVVDSVRAAMQGKSHTVLQVPMPAPPANLPPSPSTPVSSAGSRPIATATVGPPGTIFVGSRVDQVFFLATCMAAQDLAESNRRYFKTEEEALTAKYRRSRVPGC